MDSKKYLENSKEMVQMEIEKLLKWPSKKNRKE